MAKKRRKLKKKVLIIPIIVVFAIILGIFLIPNKSGIKLIKEKTTKAFIASDNVSVKLYDSEYNEVSDIFRGSEVLKYDKDITVNENTYNKIKYNDKTYYVMSDNVVLSESEVIKEKELFVRTSTTIYKDTTNKIESYVKKGERLDIIGYDKITNGVVNRYKIKYNDIEGYVYGKYLVNTKELADAVYDENGLQEYMSGMGDYLGGGTASHLDYYPYEKPHFEDNVMPDEVRSLYLNGSVVSSIDSYIELAKESNINALVIDIKDGSSSYDSPVMKEYSPTNASHALNSYEDFKTYVKKAKDAGLYVIGRITTFKDSYYVEDHKETAITNSSGQPFSHNGSYWPTAYNRDVWEFSVSLAIEAVKEVGFNEIQFDYVRFPDRTTTLERNGTINLNNTYGEEKASALQTFIMYACDNIHEAGAYVSIDVFGESASNYVTAYGQFWSAISNVADVISGMPYPDHFNAHEYGISEVVWTVPYKLLNEWGKYVRTKQDITPTPAVVRTWIQTYNTTKTPSVIYDANKVSEEITALYDNGLTGGYMTWNGQSNLGKYREVSAAFRKEYNR